MADLETLRRPFQRSLKNEKEAQGLITRISSIKIDFENEKRRTLQEFSTRGFRISELFYPPEREKVVRRLYKHEELAQVYMEIISLLFPTTESRLKKDSKPLIEFLTQVFIISPTQHDTFMEKAKLKATPTRVLYLEVIEAKNLPAKDLNGLSDPFCIVYITNKELSQRTKVVQESLCPKWNECFKLDYDPEERMRDKLKRFGDIKSTLGSIGAFVRDVGHGRSSAQEFMGQVEIPMREISSEAVEKWVGLEVGELYLKMALGIEKSRHAAVQQYRTIHELLILKDLDQNGIVTPFHWDNKFHLWAQYLIRQLKTGWALLLKDTLLAEWISVVNVHTVFSINCRIFPGLALELLNKVQQFQYDAQEVQLVWKSAEKFINYANQFLMGIHDLFPCTATVSQLYYILKTLEVIGKYSRIEGQIGRPDTLSLDSINETMTQSLSTGASHFFDSIYVKMGLPVKGSDEDEEDVSVDSKISQITTELDKVVKLGFILNQDLQKGKEMVEKELKMILGIDYSDITYKVYDELYGKLVELFVKKFYKVLLDIPEEQTFSVATKEWMGLHKLYLCMREIANNCPNSCRVSKKWRIVGNFHNWFYPGVLNLLEALSILWKLPMQKAVETDYELEEFKELISYIPYDRYFISCSAFDSVQMSLMIKNFWISLSWPDAKQSACIFNQVLVELCGYSIEYANLVKDKLGETILKQNPSQVTTSSAEVYKITPRLCMTINNIDHVWRYTAELATQLRKGIKPENFEGILDNTLDKQLEVQKSGQSEVISGIFRTASKKLEPQFMELMSKLLQVKGGNQAQFNQSMDNCLKFYKLNLDPLSEHLIPPFFVEGVTAVWDASVGAAKSLIETGSKTEKGYEYFSQIKEILEIVQGYMESEMLQQDPSKTPHLTEDPNYLEILVELQMLAAPWSKLEMSYYGQRFKSQSSSTGQSGNGVVTIRTYYQTTKETLVVEILNARNLTSMDSNGFSDPYAEVKVIPSTLYRHQGGRHTTKTHKATLYPLFDETFSINVKKSELEEVMGYLQINILDYDYIGRDELIGEAFLPLKDITQSAEDKRTQDLGQLFLPLLLPSESDMKVLSQVACARPWEKASVVFLKQETEKMYMQLSRKPKS